MATDPRVDAYIARASAFAKPILQRIRAAVHKGHPAASESIKWGVPAYMDARGIICMTPAFKRHCAWVFWSGRTPAAVDSKALRRITSVKELPSVRELVAIVRDAASRADAPKKKTVRRPATPVRVPAYFAAALRSDAKVGASFAALAPSHKREYVSWIASARTDETRRRRIATALQWIAAGKSRNWKYE